MVGKEKNHPCLAEYKEMFDRIDKENDGEVFIFEVLDFLNFMNSDLDQSPLVLGKLKSYRRSESDRILLFDEFLEIMDELKSVGWTRFKPVKGQPIAEKDMKKVFDRVDIDKSGKISQLEVKMAVKYLAKRYDFSDTKSLKKAITESDINGDGELTYLEFQDAMKVIEKKMVKENELRSILDNKNSNPPPRPAPVPVKEVEPEEIEKKEKVVIDMASIKHPLKEEYLEMFEKIDKEDDGEVYVFEVLDFLRSLNADMDQTPKVTERFREYRRNEDRALYFDEFLEIMDDIKAAGWSRFKPVKGQPIAEKDMKKVFKMVDMDKSGSISQLEMKLALKYLGKRYGIADLDTWKKAMKEADINKDGRLSYLEFQDAIKYAEEKILNNNENDAE